MLGWIGTSYIPCSQFELDFVSLWLWDPILFCRRKHVDQDGGGEKIRHLLRPWCLDLDIRSLVCRGAIWHMKALTTPHISLRLHQCHTSIPQTSHTGVPHIYDLFWSHLLFSANICNNHLFVRALTCLMGQRIIFLYRAVLGQVLKKVRAFSGRAGVFSL